MKTQHGRDLDGQEMGQILDEFVNGAPDEAKRAFVEQITKRTHRTLQQGIMGLIIKLMEAWAEDAKNPDRYDPRNEATVKLAQKFIEVTGDKYDRYLPLI